MMLISSVSMSKNVRAVSRTVSLSEDLWSSKSWIINPLSVAVLLN